MHEDKSLYLVLKGHYKQFMLFLTFFHLSMDTSWLSQLLSFFFGFGFVENSSAWFQFTTQQKLFVPLTLCVSLNKLIIFWY